MRTAICICVLTLSALGQDATSPWNNKLWTASVAAHLLATMTDGATSSYLIDKRGAGIETNPLIVAANGGRADKFWPRGFTVKASSWGGITVAQYILIRKLQPKWPRVARYCSIVNFGLAGAYGIQSAHNWSHIRKLP